MAGTTLAAWGEPVGLAAARPAWRADASNSAAEQAQQVGQHHGGLHYAPLDGSRRGLLVLGHSATDDGLLHPNGSSGWSPEKVAKAQAARGLSVVEVERQGATWALRRPSPYARRITANTPMALTGPGAGHALLRSAADPAGTRALGLLAGSTVCATPWGTVLVGDAGFADCFGSADRPTADEQRWGLQAAPLARWHEIDTRFDAVRHPNEPHRHGWLVELDPADAASPAVKRTAPGRAARAGCAVAVGRDGRAVVYSSDDGAAEYLFKFVSRDRIQPAGTGRSAARANAQLLDHGQLHVARFDAGGTGVWLPLQHGRDGLTPAQGFADAASVLVKARQAADAVVGTRLDAPGGLALDAASGWVYLAQGASRLRGAPGQPGFDAVHPQATSGRGRVLRWRERSGAEGETFAWQTVMLAGPADAALQPRGLALSPRGTLWLGSGAGKGDQPGQLWRAEAGGASWKSVATGPRRSDLSAVAWTPDGATMFVNVQHPGSPSAAASNPARPTQLSAWPDHQAQGRPRSATVAVQRLDGGAVDG